MVCTILLATLPATASLVQGHFHFVRLAHNGIWQDPLRYIRNVTSPYYEPFNPDPYDQRPNRSISDPTYYADAPNSVRCGRGNLDHAPTTDILKVKADDTIEFVNANLGYADYEDTRYWDCPDGRGFCTYWGPQPPETYVRQASMNVLTVLGTRKVGEGYWANVVPQLMKIVHTGPVSMYLSAVPSGQQIGEYDGSGEWVKIKTFGVEIRKDMEKPYWLANNNTDEDYGTFTRGLPSRVRIIFPSEKVETY